MSEQVKWTDLESALASAWSKDTSADPKGWSKENPAWGQCAVTALVVQDFRGGSLLRLDISKHPNPVISAMRSHYFNRVDEGGVSHQYDFSASQFGLSGQVGVRRHTQELPQEKKRDYLLSNESTNARYKSLRLKVANILSGNNILFENEIFILCLVRALDSDCVKGKYGCVVTYDGSIKISVPNAIMEPLKDWSEPECVRLKISSRTESMIGCCSHAEERALVTIRDLKVDPKDCALYVAGFRSNGLVYIKPEPVFTCLRCAVQLYMHKIGAIYVPCQNGWARMTAEEAVKTAKKFAIGEKKLENHRP